MTDLKLITGWRSSVRSDSGACVEVCAAERPVPAGDPESRRGQESTPGPSPLWESTKDRAGAPQTDHQAAAVLPAEPSHTAQPDEGRRWRIELPAGMQLLNSNDRLHWSARARITKNLRWTAFCAARMKKIPPMQRVHVLAEYEPPDRRRRDPGNLYPSIKACVDGLVDAKVCPDDDASHLIGPDMRLSEDTFPLGRIVLVITELLNPSETS